MSEGLMTSRSDTVHSLQLGIYRIEIFKIRLAGYPPEYPAETEVEPEPYSVMAAPLLSVPD